MLRWKQIIIFTGPALTSVCIVAVTLSCNRIIREFLRNSSIPVDYRLMTSESRGLRIRYQCFLKGTHRPLRRQSNEWTIKCVWWCCFVAKSGPILCEPTDCSPPSSSVHGITQARVLEQAAMSFSRGSSQPRDQTHVSCLADGFFTTKPFGQENPKQIINCNIPREMRCFIFKQERYVIWTNSK